MPFRSAVAFAVLLSFVGACQSPPPRSLPMGLEAPVMSPPGGLSAQERLSWWEQQLPRLTSADRSEARLAMGELSLQLGNAKEARITFYEAKGGRLAASEMAQAERGIGLSYFLDGQVALGVPHLERSRENLEVPAQQEVDFLLAAVRGDAVAAGSDLLSQRMSAYMEASHLTGPVEKSNPAMVGQIQVDITRAQWGAAAMQSNWDRMTTPYRIAIHHTAEPFTATSVSATAAEVRNVQATHMHRDDPMADIGYHFLIDRAGRVVEGRPLYAQGAHASGDFNIGNIGICLLGNFSAQPERGASYAKAQRPSAAQMATLERLVDQLRQIYNIKASQVQGHRELKNTECPGDELAAWVKRYQRSG
jgi:hypothetical protein